MVRRLSRPFGRVHYIVGEAEEMRRHPSIMDRAPTGKWVFVCVFLGVDCVDICVCMDVCVWFVCVWIVFL